MSPTVSGITVCCCVVLFCTIHAWPQPAAAFMPANMRQSFSMPVRAPIIRFMLDAEEPELSNADEVEDEGGNEENDSPQENPEVSALKQEILDLESALKAKKSSLTYALDQVEEYSKAGYARAVAEMENMRRVRSSMNSSNKSSVMAGIIRDFLPVYDRIESLKEKYAGDQFGSKYGGLSIGPTFSKMGVREFVVAEGDPVEPGRMVVISSEHSESPKDTVLAVIADGLELGGNVVRPAQCIASLGKETEPSEEGENNDSQD